MTTTINKTLNSVNLAAVGDLDLHAFLGLRDTHAGFSSIKAWVTITSDAPNEKIDALHRKVIATSPVGHNLQQSVPLTVEPT